MKRLHWSLLWLGSASSLAGCYGNTEPGGVAVAPGSSLPIDTSRYAPTETAPIVYRSRVQQSGRPLPPKVVTDTNVIARLRTPKVTVYPLSARSRPDATTLPATRRVQEATDRELRALSPLGKLPASPVPRVAPQPQPVAPTE